MKKVRSFRFHGPVVDVVLFAKGHLPPCIKDALEVDNNGKKCVMEVAQHIGNDTVRCIMLASSEGLHRDMEVTATGAGITVPVGKATWDDCSMFWVRRSMMEKPVESKKTGVSTEIRHPLKIRARL